MIDQESECVGTSPFIDNFESSSDESIIAPVEALKKHRLCLILASSYVQLYPAVSCHEEYFENAVSTLPYVAAIRSIDNEPFSVSCKTTTLLTMSANVLLID